MVIKRPQSKQPLPKGAKRVFKGVMFDVYQWKQKMFDGSIQIFEKLKRADTVIVIPITKDEKIILTEQRQPAKKPFISVAGGRVDDGESIEKAAHRELLEETGYKTDELILWNAIQPVGKIEWAIYTFIAKNCQKVADLKLDPGEKIKLKFVTFKQFLKVVDKQDFDDLEIINKVNQAKLDPKKMKELKQLFFG